MKRSYGDPPLLAWVQAHDRGLYLGAMTRDDDPTLTDIRFQHDVLDPSVHPESHAPDINVGYMNVDDDNHRGPLVVGLIMFCVVFSLMYVLWVLLLDHI